MKKINILLAIFFFVFNCCSTKTNEDKKVHIDSVLKKTHDSILTYQERVESVVLKNDNLTIIGDSANLVKNIYSILIKFEPYISFDDYKVDTIYNGTISKIDYNSNPIAKEYKTMITQTYIEEKVNFAGHYCFARWRCGAPCNEFALVDVIDGKYTMVSLLQWDLIFAKIAEC